MPVSTYTKEQLEKMHVSNFRSIFEQYGKGNCVGFTWFLRVSNNGAQLVTPYKVKDEETGEWSGMNEYTMAL